MLVSTEVMCSGFTKINVSIDNIQLNLILKINTGTMRLNIHIKIFFKPNEFNPL